jgi:hypothetical protein
METGRILRTTHRGGYIRSADGVGIPFVWKDCEMRPDECGFDTPVSFYVEFERGRPRAFAVKRRTLPRTNGTSSPSWTPPWRKKKVG